MNEIKNWFIEREKLYSELVNDENFISSISASAKIIIDSLNAGGKIMIFGNGGSAAEAQHFAAELVGRFEKNRKALPAIALTTDTSIITAQANDDSFATIFSRQIEALGKPGDIVIGMTTSDVYLEEGHSANILKAFESAQENNLHTIGLFSARTSNLLNNVEIPIIINHTNTALIQEAHLSVVHSLCRIIEKQY